MRNATQLFCIGRVMRDLAGASIGQNVEGDTITIRFVGIPQYCNAIGNPARSVVN